MSSAYCPFAEWKKAHKDKLAIVGVTFYPSDISQNLGIDKESGDLTTVAKADKKSDQALLLAFARHHKIEHSLRRFPSRRHSRHSTPTPSTGCHKWC